MREPVISVTVSFVASIAILLITLMGLLGYITDEMHRRSKEIAIRKVNGATAPNILRLLSKDVFGHGFPGYPFRSDSLTSRGRELVEAIRG